MSQISGPPTDFSGCVERFTSNSVNPKVLRMSSVRSSTPLISSAIWCGRQNMCASSWVKPRTRNRPCIVPLRSYRYTVPISAQRMGRSR